MMYFLLTLCRGGLTPHTTDCVWWDFTVVKELEGLTFVQKSGEVHSECIATAVIIVFIQFVIMIMLRSRSWSRSHNLLILFGRFF